MSLMSRSNVPRRRGLQASDSRSAVVDLVAPPPQDQRQVPAACPCCPPPGGSAGPSAAARRARSAPRAGSRRRAGATRRQLERERAPRSRPGAGGRQAAAVGLRQRPADGQPQAQPAAVAAARRVALLERLEDPGQDLRLDPHARCRRTSTTRRAAVAGLGVGAALRERIGDATPPAGGELGRVLDQVPEDLLQPRRVGLDVVLGGRQVQLHARARPWSISPRQISSGLADERRGRRPAPRSSASVPRPIRATSSRSSISRASSSMLRRIISSVGAQAGGLGRRRASPRRPAARGSAGSAARG